MQGRWIGTVQNGFNGSTPVRSTSGTLLVKINTANAGFYASTPCGLHCRLSAHSTARRPSQQHRPNGTRGLNSDKRARNILFHLILINVQPRSVLINCQIGALQWQPSCSAVLSFDKENPRPCTTQALARKMALVQKPLHMYISKLDA